MNFNLPIMISIICLFLFCGCDPSTGFYGELSSPKEAHVDLSDQTLTKFDKDLSKILFRYLAGNPRWEIRKEGGIRYAVRKERVNGEYETSLNGFYSTYANGGAEQRRVLISFGKPYGFGREYGNITRTEVGKKPVSVIIESEHSGTPGNSSYTIISGGTVFLEIYDQAPQIQRVFTQSAFDEVCAELSDVIAHSDSIEKSGIIPIGKYYPKQLHRKGHFEVNDGMQPGIYVISAAVSPTEPGYVYMKAYNTKTGERLSEQRMTPRTTRYLGWSADSIAVFSYESELTVYEGDWSSKYEARFELWHRAETGQEKKLTESTRMINGWQR